MSGGVFQYNQYQIKDIEETIQHRLDRNGKKLTSEERWMDDDFYRKYPDEAYHEEYSEEVVEIFKKAILTLREAYIYSQRIDWFLSGDDGEEELVKRLKEELEKIKNENK